MSPQKKKIVILGAGFAGLRTALLLGHKLRSDPRYEIFLIDERDNQVYTPDLYEIATAYNEEITGQCLLRLKASVTTPLKNIPFGKNVQTMRQKVTALNIHAKKIEFKNHSTMDFDYLVLTLGSATNYYDIPGLKEFSMPLKKVRHALAICCHLDMFFQELWQKRIKKDVSIVVGGGGPTGVEFACELSGNLDKLCKKYRYPRKLVHITVVEGSDQLTGQGPKVTAVIQKRFEQLGVRALLGIFIKGVTEHEIITAGPDNKAGHLPQDILIWTGGVKPNPLIAESFPQVAKNGALPVNRFLQHEKFPHIFAAGDNAWFFDEAMGKSAPMLAQVALNQAGILVHNVLAQIQGGKKKSYRLRLKGIVIPLGGKYAVLKTDRFVFKGFFMWGLQRLIDLSYLLRILPWRFAIPKWIHNTNVFIGNDNH